MTIDEFKIVDLRVVTIIEAVRMEGSEKLVKLQVELGTELGKRQVLAGIGKKYSPEELIGKQIIVVANLEPRKLMGEESQGMLLAAHDENGEPVILTVEKNVPAGSKIS